MISRYPLAKLSQFLKLRKEFFIIKDSEEYQLVTVQLHARGIRERSRLLGSEIKTKKQQLIKAGDLLVAEIDAKVGGYGIVPPYLNGAIVSGHYFLYEIDQCQIDPEFLGYYLQTGYPEQDLQQFVKGSVNYAAIRSQHFFELEIPLPSLEDQQRIVNKIKMLSDKIKQLELLQEKAKEESAILVLSIMKNFRSELLKSSYSREKMGFLTKVTSGGTPSRSNPSYWGGTIPWLKTGELHDGDIEDAEEFITHAGLLNSSAKIFPVDTILIALYGQGQTRGRTGRLAIEAATNQACCAVLPVDCLEPQYLQYWLSSMYTELREKAHGGAQPNWNIQMIKDLEIVIPPKIIQERFIDQISRYNIKVKELTKIQQSAYSVISSLLPSLLDKAFQGKLT